MARNSLLIVALFGIAVYCTGCSADNTANVSVRDILERIQSDVSTIESIEIATEETDDNNLLGKQGQYIELGWFVDSRVEKLEVYADRLYDNPQDADGNFLPIGYKTESGTAGGGAIEKFSSVQDAKKRSEYLDKFNAADVPSFLSPGYHEQYGVFVIRVSKNLTATQQRELAEQIKKSIR